MREEKQVLKNSGRLSHGNIPTFLIKMLDYILTNYIRFSDPTTFL